MHLLALHLFPLGDSALIYCAFFLMASTAVVLAQNLDRLRSPFGENIAVLSVHALAIAADLYLRQGAQAEARQAIARLREVKPDAAQLTTLDERAAGEPTPR